MSSSSFNNRYFMIFNISELENIDFTQVIENSFKSIRLNVSGSKTFVKWEGETPPSSIDALTTKEGPFSYREILSILAEPSWTSEPI